MASTYTTNKHSEFIHDLKQTLDGIDKSIQQAPSAEEHSKYFIFNMLNPFERFNVLSLSTN